MLILECFHKNISLTGVLCHTLGPMFKPDCQVGIIIMFLGLSEIVSGAKLNFQKVSLEINGNIGIDSKSVSGK